MFSKPFWLTFISFGETSLISETAASLEEIGKITLAATLKNKNNQPSPGSHPAWLFHAEWLMFIKEMKGWHPMKSSGQITCSDTVFLIIWNIHCFRVFNVLQVACVHGGVSKKQRLRCCAVHLYNFACMSRTDPHNPWVQISCCSRLWGLSPLILSSSCVSVTFKKTNLLLKSQEVLTCCCWGKGT